MIKISKESTYASKAESKVSKNISFEQKNPFLKQTTSAITCEDGHARFTVILLKTFDHFLGRKVFNSNNFYIYFLQ